MPSESPLVAALDPEDVGWFRSKLSQWGDEHLRSFPWRATTSSYEILVAEFLLQQTDAPRVEPVYEEFLANFPSLEDLADANPSEVRDVLEPLGLHFRAERLQDVAKTLVAEEGSPGVPADEESLLQLPGVGPYIARSVLSHAYQKPAAVLDTNVTRILMRFFGLTPSRARPRRDPEMAQVAQRVAPADGVSRWNLVLVDFGAALCTARNPSCDECPLAQRCNYAKEASGRP